VVFVAVVVTGVVSTAGLSVVSVTSVVESVLFLRACLRACLLLSSLVMLSFPALLPSTKPDRVTDGVASTGNASALTGIEIIRERTDIQAIRVKINIETIEFLFIFFFIFYKFSLVFKILFYFAGTAKAIF